LVDPTPIPVSLSTLWLRRPPGGLGFFTERLPNTERQVYRMFVRLVSAQLEPDRDIHLVVAEPGRRRRTDDHRAPQPPAATRCGCRPIAQRCGEAGLLPSGCASPSTSGEAEALWRSLSVIAVAAAAAQLGREALDISVDASWAARS
jgi:hypothetical protein